MGEPPNLSTAAMNFCVGRRKFLVSYSQADEYKFSTRESFGIMLEVEFNARTMLLKRNIDLVSERSTRMMAPTITAC